MYYKTVHGKIKCPNCGQRNLKGSLYCNLCYEPFNKKRSHQKEKAAPAAPVHGQSSNVPRLLKAGLLAIAAAIALSFAFRPDRQPGTPGGRTAGMNSFAEQTAAADKLLGDYLVAKEALLTEIQNGQPDPEGFGIAGQYTRKLFTIEENYAAAMEGLNLPAETGVDKARDAGYLEWLETHRREEGLAMADFSGKYQKLILRAGVGR